MIYLNEAMIGGEVASVQRREAKKIARININVPAGDEDREDDAGKTLTIPVDVVDEQYDLCKDLKAGDYFSCKAWLVPVKMPADGKDGKYTVRWLQALKSRPLVIIPGGGKVAKAAFNDICFQGRVTRITELSKSSGGKAMIFVTVSYVPKSDKNATDEEKKAAMVYADVAFFGSTAEKFIAPYLKEGDCILVQGMLRMREERWTSAGKAVVTPQINARDAKFLTPVARGEGGTRPKIDKARTDAYETGGDDDVAF